jgi:hypothetical protein
MQCKDLSVQTRFLVIKHKIIGDVIFLWLLRLGNVFNEGKTGIFLKLWSERSKILLTFQLQYKFEKKARCVSISGLKATQNTHTHTHTQSYTQATLHIEYDYLFIYLLCVSKKFKTNTFSSIRNRKLEICNAKLCHWTLSWVYLFSYVQLNVILPQQSPSLTQ